jgi:hypothetical protein
MQVTNIINAPTEQPQKPKGKYDVTYTDDGGRSTKVAQVIASCVPNAISNFYRRKAHVRVLGAALAAS